MKQIEDKIKKPRKSQIDKEFVLKDGDSELLTTAPVLSEDEKILEEGDKDPDLKYAMRTPDDAF